MGSEVRARAGAKVLSEGEGATEGSGGWQASKLWLSILCVPTAEFSLPERVLEEGLLPPGCGHGASVHGRQEREAVALARGAHARIIE